jgi:hypothetical protein
MGIPVAGDSTRQSRLFIFLPGSRVEVEMFDELLSLFKSVSVSQSDPEQLLSVWARMAIRKAASDEVAIAAIHAAFDEGGISNPFSPAQLIEYLRWAGNRTRSASDEVFANYATEFVGSKKTKKPLTMQTILERWRHATDGWPRRIGNVPFVHDEFGLTIFNQHQVASVMGFIRHHVGHVDWINGPGFVSEAEFVAELKRVAQNYSTVELLPHEPAIDGIYYACEVPEPGDGSHLEGLLAFYSPATPSDRELIKAKILSDFAGLPPGTKPVFVFTSDEGCGVGKTKAGETTADIAGGMIAVSAGDPIAEIKKRLLSSEGQTKRTVLIDNVKTDKFSWADLESLTTARTISGHRMYSGEGERPNTLTYVITLNGVNLSEDMAQRCVIIKLVRGEYSGSWYEDITRYINDNREAIIADIVGALRAAPTPLDQYSRWATWEKHVLSKLENPEAVQDLILERQGEASSDRDEANLIEEYFGQQIAANGYDPLVAQLRIPNRTVATWFNEATNERMRTAAITRRLNQMANEGQIHRLSPDASRYHGRCFIWSGQNADVTESISNFEPNEYEVTA